MLWYRYEAVASSESRFGNYRRLIMERIEYVWRKAHAILERTLFLMPTLEERVGVLERKMALFNLFQSQAVRKADEGSPHLEVSFMVQTNENLTMLLGVQASQGGDIKEIKEHVIRTNERLERLEAVTDEHTAVLDEQTTLLNEHTTRFDRVEALLGQILERLPA